LRESQKLYSVNRPGGHRFSHRPAPPATTWRIQNLYYQRTWTSGNLALQATACRFSGNTGETVGFRRSPSRNFPARCHPERSEESVAACGNFKLTILPNRQQHGRDLKLPQRCTLPWAVILRRSRRICGCSSHSKHGKLPSWRPSTHNLKFRHTVFLSQCHVEERSDETSAVASRETSALHTIRPRSQIATKMHPPMGCHAERSEASAVAFRAANGETPAWATIRPRSLIRLFLTVTR